MQNNDVSYEQEGLKGEEQVELVGGADGLKEQKTNTKTRVNTASELHFLAMLGFGCLQ